MRESEQLRARPLQLIDGGDEGRGNRVPVGDVGDGTQVVRHLFVPEETERAVEVDGRRRKTDKRPAALHLDNGERLVGAELSLPRGSRILRGLEQARGGILPPQGEPFAGKIGERGVVPTDAYLHGVEA
ncbi:MAG: hypothetical protein E6G46_04705 [Actinobacteria bacterium]|nr:MAG: hypothetical protein E6G46_04705 [Actinomycetota bacterium]